MLFSSRGSGKSLRLGKKIKTRPRKSTKLTDQELLELQG